MLIAAVAVPMIAALVLRAVSPVVAQLLPPPTAVRLLVVAAFVTAAASGFGLAVTAFSVAGQDSEIAAAGHWSAVALRRLAGVPAPIGIVAGAVVSALLVATVFRATRAIGQLWVADATCRRLGADVHGLVVVEDERPDAYALQGLRGRMVVSTGMLAALAPAERRVLFAHEASHLANRHALLIALADVSASANPLLRPVAGAVRDGVERWADEDAASLVGDRRLAARAIARAALAAHPRPRVGGLATGLAATGGTVGARARALLVPPPRPRRTLAGLLLMVTLTAAAGALTAEHITERNFERAEAPVSATG